MYIKLFGLFLILLSITNLISALELPPGSNFTICFVPDYYIYYWNEANITINTILYEEGDSENIIIISCTNVVTCSFQVQDYYDNGLVPSLCYSMINLHYDLIARVAYNIDPLDNDNSNGVITVLFIFIIVIFMVTAWCCKKYISASIDSCCTGICKCCSRGCRWCKTKANNIGHEIDRSKQERLLKDQQIIIDRINRVEEDRVNEVL